MAGMLVALEGIDGAGKSEMRALIAHRLREVGKRVVECGELQSPWADSIRSGLGKGYTPFLKTFLFATDRAWTYEKVCLPALREDCVVLWDRYVDSAIVYRSVEVEAEPALLDLRFVRAINRPFRQPDLTILLDLPVAIALQRSREAQRHEPYDEGFLERARAEYLTLAKGESRYVIINADASRHEIASQCEAAIARHIRPGKAV
jgi:dTMP kinase